MPSPASSRDLPRRSVGTAKSINRMASCPRGRASCGEAIKLSRREMRKSRNPRSRFTARQLGRGAILTALALGAQSGCTREFYREWANQDVSEAVFEKTRDPRWRMDVFSVEPPRSRGSPIRTIRKCRLPPR